MSSYLISKLPTYIMRLHLLYKNAGHQRLSSLIKECHFVANENEDYDNWNGGSYGHDIILFLPLDILSTVPLEDIEPITERILYDLRTLGQRVENEYFHLVRLEAFDENDRDFQRSTPLFSNNPVAPEAAGFWKNGYARIFVSHRDMHKHDARQLGDALEAYGFSCFVAHDTIQPMSEWRKEILKGLETMEVMLLFLTDDFEKSLWCQQEVGFALGKRVPIISLKLNNSDPPGFISHVQAVRGNREDPISSARALFPLVGKVLGRQDRIEEALISSLIESPDWTATRDRFDRVVKHVTKLSETQVGRLIEGFRSNDQLFNAIYLIGNSERFCTYLERASGRKFLRQGREIKEIKPNQKHAHDNPF